MGSLERQTRDGHWLEVTGPAGTELVDAALVGDFQEYSSKKLVPLLDSLKSRCVNHKAWSVCRVSGLAARLVAPEVGKGTVWIPVHSQEDAGRLFDLLEPLYAGGQVELSDLPEKPHRNRTVPNATQYVPQKKDTHRMSSPNSNPKFPLGEIVATPGALQALARSNQTPEEFLQRHVTCDWGDVSQGDKQLNDQALIDGSRLLSAYTTAKGEKLWIITEADRSSTCLLLPEEY